MNEDKNLGLLIAKPKSSDYVFGGLTSIKTLREVADWAIYIPSFEKQYSSKTDFLICATMSGIDHSVVSQLNYLLFTKQLSSEALNFFHNNNYIVDGVFSLSSRFNAKLNGTDIIKGNSLPAVAENARKVGFVPESVWPTSEDMTWDEFYSSVPQNIIDLGKKALWFIKLEYQWILDRGDIPLALKSGPVQIGIALCPGYSAHQTVLKCSNKSPSHAVMNFKQDDADNWIILDHYAPSLKILASDYELPYNLHYLVSPKGICLRKTMWGDNVFKLQKDLNVLGYKLEEDSFLGPKTESAIKDFQNKNKLVADGIAGEKTLKKIKELLPILSSLVNAIIKVESGGDDHAVGDKNLIQKAYGALQIRQPLVDDVNRLFHTKYKSIDCLGNRKLSLWLFDRYMEIYGKDKTDEQKSRLWNGGPSGLNIPHNNAKIEKMLQEYWQKVKKFI